MRLSLDPLRPQTWTVRVRSAVASTVVVAVCLIIAGGALLGVLHSSLETSARDAAAARAVQVAEQLETDTPPEIDQSLLATDAQIGSVQIVDGSGDVVAASQGDARTALSAVLLTDPQSAELGRAEVDGGDFWVSGRGANSPGGPVTVLVGADREPVETVIATVAALLAVVGPFVIALVAFATYRLVGAALSPVERLRRQVASISNSQLSERLPVPQAQDEITRLAVTMNEMLARLEAGQRGQQRFVSDASHELRSPLSTITAALELAASRPDLLDESMIDESLLPEARRMRHLIDDLLLLARSDETGGQSNPVDVDLDDIVFEEARRVAAVSDLEVTSSITPVRVSGDQRALARAIRNIVDNAVRHASTQIRLSTYDDGTVAHVVVDDDGPGVPEAERARVFDRFVRLDSSRSRDIGGAGLGLAIVAGTVAAHSGTADVTRSPLGGARVSLHLPM